MVSFFRTYSFCYDYIIPICVYSLLLIYQILTMNSIHQISFGVSICESSKSEKKQDQGARDSESYVAYPTRQSTQKMTKILIFSDVETHESAKRVNSWGVCVVSIDFGDVIYPFVFLGCTPFVCMQKIGIHLICMIHK